MGVKALSHRKPNADEDVLMIFIGDEECANPNFANAIREAGLRPMAFGLIRMLGRISSGGGAAVRNTATQLQIPCFMIDKGTFEDPYDIPRKIRALVAATPVGVAAVAEKPRLTLVDQILKTEVLAKPAWAA